MTAPHDTAPVVDPVLAAARRPIPPEAACAEASRAFGLVAASARDLGSERDQTLLLQDSDGESLGVLKISNPAEDPATLDMEACAVLHATSADPQLRIPLPHPASGRGSDREVTARRAMTTASGPGQWMRLYDVLPGRARAEANSLDDRALTAMGETAARVDRALRGFIHPRAIRRLPWDVQHALACRPMLPAIPDREARDSVAAVLDRFEQAVSPRWAGLRAQVIHGDLTVDNVLVDEAGLVSAVIDFGDMSHTALVGDLACLLDSVSTGREPADLFRVARVVLDGYQRVTPLEEGELELLAELWAARSAVTIAIGSWRAREGLEDPDFAQRYSHSAAVVLDHLLTTGWARAARLLGARPAPSAPATGLADRRAAAFGPAIEALSYDEPIEMASADGVWMTDAAGRRFLDMYNNVPCVGHSHPRVVQAMARQSRLLNTNLRYLHPGAVELAERLLATCPPALDTVLFVNSGSEANDLAWRLATRHTGQDGGLCTSFAYHGITAAMAPFSPETLPEGPNRTPVERWSPPDSYRSRHLDTVEFRAALERLGERGFGLAATLLDGVLQSDGVLDLEPDYVQELVRMTRAAGGLWVADEVQGGHGRTGEAMWSFQRFGIEPDFVTLGKAMGNGQPVGAVITRREIAESFGSDTVFFSTFAGNQVSVAAATAVLDVLDDERVLPRVVAAGESLRRGIQDVVAGDDRVGDVRGMGLASGIEVVESRATKRPDAVTASRLKEALRQRGVLVGTTGAQGNVLKVRPPLAFTREHVPLFTAALRAALHDRSRGPVVSRRRAHDRRGPHTEAGAGRPPWPPAAP